MNTGNKTKGSKGCGFQALGLSNDVFRGIMSMGYKVPTPIQRKALPIVLSGKDVVAMARTGSGKTAAFLIPLYEKLKEHSSRVGVRALILSPTRELAIQTIKFTKSMAKYTNLKATLIVGGDSMDQQFESLANNPDIIVATPGRLMHLLQEIPDFNFKNVEYLVFDEADRLFEMGFAEQLNEIMKDLPEQRQTVLFSATLPKVLVQFARAGLNDPALIRLDLESKISENLQLAFFSTRSDCKPALFLYLLRDFIPMDQQTIVFAATKHHVEFLHQLLTASNIPSSCVYGDMDQTARTISIGKFRAKKTMILVVTDVAARGIDIPFLNNVINYNFPSTPKLFVHRVGRAARAGRSGAAFNLVEPDELPFVIDLHLFLGRRVESVYTDKQGNAGVGYSLTTMSTEDCHIGCFPRSIIDNESESFAELMKRNKPIVPLVKVVSNAYKQYCRTRPDPSKQSIKRSKELLTTTVHPLFITATSESEVDKESYLQQLQGFRPQQTIFEVSTSSQSLKKSSASVVMMNHKRKLHEHIIQAESKPKMEEDNLISSHQPSSNTLKVKSPLSNIVEPDVTTSVNKRKLSKAERKVLKKQKLLGDSTTVTPQNDSTTTNTESEKGTVEYKDKENYISYMKDTDRVIEDHLMPRSGEDKGMEFSNSRLEEAILDVNPDEAIKMNNQRRIMHWDTRKKKYVMTTVGEVRGGKLKRRNESGARINDKKTKTGDIYKKWQKKAHKRVGVIGESEENVVGVDYRNGKRPKHDRNPNLSIGGRVNANVKDEIKSEGDIRKEKAKKDRSKGIHKKKSSMSKRGKGNIRGKSHGAPSRSKAIIRRR